MFSKNTFIVSETKLMIQFRTISQPNYSTSQQEIRISNTYMLFNLIRELAPVSRVELSRHCPLANSTVSSLVDDMIKYQWIVEQEASHTSARGRKAVMLEVNAKCGYIITVELLSIGYICTLYDARPKKILSKKIKNTIYNANHIGGTIFSMLKEARVQASSLLGIHLIFPGVVDPITGELIGSTAFTDLETIDRYLVIQLRSIFPKALVQISTNGTIIAYEEFEIKKSGSPLPLLSVNVDEAIFGGVVMSNPESNMYFCFPVELGHMTIDMNGEKCSCGNRGCLEHLCSTPELFRKINQATNLNLEISDLSGSDCNVESMKIVARELWNGNPIVIHMLQNYSRALCSGLISTINMLGIRSVRIGGDLAILGDPFLNMLRTIFQNEFHPLMNNQAIQFELFNSDYEQVRIAATMMCLDAVFKK